MEKQLFPNVPPGDRARMIQDNADEVESKRYSVSLNEDELNAARKAVAECSIEIHNLEAEKKEFMEDFKSKMKPIKLHLSAVLEEVRYASTIREGDLYKMIDREAKRVGYYTLDGNLVEERNARPEEMQFSIKMQG